MVAGRFSCLSASSTNLRRFLPLFLSVSSFYSSFPRGFVAYLNARYVCNMAMSARISRVHRGVGGVTTQSPEIPLSSFLRFYYTLAAISVRRPFDEP